MRKDKFKDVVDCEIIFNHGESLFFPASIRGCLQKTKNALEESNKFPVPGIWYFWLTIWRLWLATVIIIIIMYR